MLRVREIQYTTIYYIPSFPRRKTNKKGKDKGQMDRDLKFYTWTDGKETYNFINERTIKFI